MPRQDTARPRTRDSNGDILVIGAGVAGLTTALRLRQSGFGVTVVADQWPPAVDAAGGYVSVVAGALWEYPPSVCGRHHDEEARERARDWSLTSYRVFENLEKQGIPGVRMRRARFYFPYHIEEHPDEAAKMQALREHTKGFRRELEDEPRPNVEFDDPPIEDAYSHIAPTIHTNEYMVWLQEQLQSKGVEMVHDTIDDSRPLREQEAELCQRFDVQAIVNCTGLGAGKLVPDASMTSHRGALVRVRNDGTQFPRITDSYAIMHDEQYSSGHGFVYLIPRGDILVLGGITEPDEWSTDVTLDSYEPFQEMLHRCYEFMPELEQAEFDDERIRVGLRPFRPDGVKLGREEDTWLIHNYGHGGAGFSLSYGCAEEVTDIIETLCRRNELDRSSE